MNVLIDALSVTRQKAGVGVYAKNIIDELVRIESNIHFFLLVQDDDIDFDYDGRSNVTMLRMDSRLLRWIPLRLLFEQLALPAILLKHRIRLIHSLHYSFPLLRFGVSQVVTLHDMTSFVMPEVHLRTKVLYFRFFIRAAIKHADGIIFVSESARKDCSELLGEPHGKVAVAHHGTNETLHSEVGREAIEAVRRKYALPAEFLLYIGTIEPRKNLVRLTEAFAEVCEGHPSLHLVLAGKKGWNRELESLTEVARRSGAIARIVFPGFIAEEDKPAVLCASKIFIYPSLYEGFGLPVLEAMACGVPTITSNVSSLPEIAGNGALLIDPRSATGIASAIHTLLSDSKLRSVLSQRGIEQAASFSWKRSAAATLQLYARVEAAS